MGMKMQFRDIARRLQIATSTAHRIFKCFEESGDIAPSKQSSRLHARKLDEHHELLIIAIVMENPCVYLREVCQRIEEATHTRVSGSTVCRILRRNGYTKKIRQVARQKKVWSTEQLLWHRYCSMIQNTFFGLMRQAVMLKAIFACLAMLYVGKLQSTTGL